MVRYSPSEAVKSVMVSLPVRTVTIASAVGGTTSPAAGTYTYPSGSSLTLTATPVSVGNKDYTFTKWVIGGYLEFTENPKTITVTVDMSIVPVFTEVTAVTTTLTVIAVDNWTTNVANVVGGVLKRVDNSVGIAGQTINLSYDSTTVGTTTTNLTGSYQFSVSIPTAGTYTLKATFGGVLGFGKSSATTNVGVLAGEVNWLPIIGTIVAIPVVGYIIYKLTRKRKRK